MIYLFKKQPPSRCWLKKTLFLNNVKIHSNNNSAAMLTKRTAVGQKAVTELKVFLS